MTPVEAVERSLSEIDRTEDAVRAWVVIDRERALAEAAQIDPSLPLAGLTVGIKDIFDIAGMPTAGGFAPFANRIASQDSALVQALRDAGAAIVGKTTTTQFASSDPTVTRNPWNLDRTPGGSSSGSAAAVAAGHVDIAIGSQTGGSTLRPAAYCGVVGLKPAHGWTDRRGMVPLGHSLDTVGIISTDVSVATRVWSAVCKTAADETRLPVDRRPRIALWHSALTLAGAEAVDATQNALRILADSGARITELVPDISYPALKAAHQLIMLTEAASAHARLIRSHPEHYSPGIRSFVETGHAVPGYAYARARAVRDDIRLSALQAWNDFDVVALTTADGGAPTRETTGSPTLQSVATMMGWPSISLPCGLTTDGMPLGLQLIAPRQDGTPALLHVARWVESTLPRLPSPGF